MKILIGPFKRAQLRVRLRRMLVQWAVRVLGAELLQVGSRASSGRITLLGRSFLIKAFKPDEVAIRCFKQELLARRLFKGRQWLVPAVRVGPRFLVSLSYRDETRLDRAVHSLGPDERFRVARQALDILFEIFLEGYAHCDFHAENLFWVEGRLMVTDFEAMQPFPRGARPAFPTSYDLVGQGLPSPYRTHNMCYIRDRFRPVALQQVLGVPLDALLAAFREELKSQIRTVSTDFKSGTGRHKCRAQRIYSSFSLPHLEVLPEEAQRDSARRFERFGIGPAEIGGRSVLDLGSNVGGMLFALQPFGPSRSVGVEYDPQKVATARKVAAYNGLDRVEFRQGDIDHLQVGPVGGPFDVVFCLAVEKHIRDQARLYRFLGEVTSEALYFEGNSTTNPEEVRSNLGRAGFRRIEFLGVSDDDCIPENNCRPLLLAWK